MKTADITTGQVLQAVRKSRAVDWRRGGEEFYPYTVLEQELGAPAKVAWRALEREAARGRLNYGVSLRTAWIDCPWVFSEAEDASVAGEVVT